MRRIVDMTDCLLIWPTAARGTPRRSGQRRGRCERVDGVVPRNGYDPHVVGHHDVLAVSDDTKTGFLKGPDGVLMVDARNTGHALRSDLDFANDGPFEKGIAGGQVSLNRVLDVLEGLLLSGALRPAAGQSRDRGAIAL